MNYTLRIFIKTKTAAKKSLIEKVNEKEYVAHLTALPQGGKVNNELLSLLSTYFKVTKDKIDIIAGEKTKQKVIEINF